MAGARYHGVLREMPGQLMTEQRILERLRRRLPPGGRAMVAGIGDDCAIWRAPKPGEDQIYTTDFLIENVHFRRESHTAADAGHKALARGLSDIAAMGGAPRFCLVSLGLPSWVDNRWIDGFYRGLLRLAAETGTSLAGGDLARTEMLVCDVVVGGTVPRGTALRRDKARAGQAIYVSGVLGGSSLGLQTGRGSAWKRHVRPAPRLSLGRYLREQLRAAAAMDLSDGLSIDLRRLCLESGVAAAVDRPLPVFPRASLDQALHGGEDYELLFTVGPRAKVPEAFEAIPLTRIGTVTKGPAGAVTFFGSPLEPRGFDHFR